MKQRSIQFQFLITIISAMLAITLFVGGLSIYEVDNFIQEETETFVSVTCEKETAQINDVFGDMEKSVHIMERYLIALIKNKAEIADPEKQAEILKLSNEMFADVAKNTDGALAYYFRFAPELTRDAVGLFYSKLKGKAGFVRLQLTDLSQYDKNDTEHVGWYWQPYEAEKPVWMLPYYNRNNEYHMISYVVPLYYDGAFIGVVGMDFDYSLLTERVHQIRIYENGFAHLEFEGADIYNADHAEDAKVHEHPEEYLSVSSELKNGMTLVLSASHRDIRKIRYEIGMKIVWVVLLLALLFSLLVIFIVRRITRPLKNLVDASVKLANREYDVEIVHSNTYEIELLSTSFEQMARQLKEHEQLQHLLAYRDTLTGLRNTNSYWAWITDFDKEIEAEEIVFGVMVLDINYLKETNDRYGHDMGNRLIVSAARIISETFKRSPVFRVGGDEFVVILQNRDLEDVEELSQKLDSECDQASVSLEGATVSVSIAKGFARYDKSRDTSFVDVFNRADDAMYENKREMKGLK